MRSCPGHSAVTGAQRCLPLTPVLKWVPDRSVTIATDTGSPFRQLFPRYPLPGPEARGPSYLHLGMARMNSVRKTLISAALLLLTGSGMGSAQEAPTLTFRGQVRPRIEARTPVDGSWDSFSSMRVRASVRAHLQDRVSIFIQFQDVRLFGEEGNTLGDFRGDNLDLHQGYLELASVPGIGGVVRAGRQEMALGEERLVGAVNWTQQGRSFDGVHYSRDLGGLTLQLFGMKLTEASSPVRDFDSDFLGTWLTHGTEGAGTIDVFGLVTRDARELGSDEETFGALWRGEFGGFSLRAEGSVQRGTRGEEDVSAHMMGFRGGTAIAGMGTVTLWYDYLSGDGNPDDGESGVFNTLFATNHAFYGFADYFLDIPVHTGGLGLTDAAVKLAFNPWHKGAVNLDLHRFQTAEQGTLSTRDLGVEVDLSARWPLAQGLTLASGYSYFHAQDGMLELGRLSEDAHWFYLMLDGVF